MIIVRGGYRVAAQQHPSKLTSGVMFQESLDHSHHDDCTNLSSAESVSSGIIWSICTIGTVTSVQDPVLEVVSELQCKIADLGNACWEVGSESHNINTVTPAASVAIIWSFN